MKKFTTTVKTESGLYDIDYKASRHSHNWCVMHNTGSVYLSSLTEAMEWIEFHSDANSTQTIY